MEMIISENESYSFRPAGVSFKALCVSQGNPACVQRRVSSQHTWLCHEDPASTNKHWKGVFYPEKPAQSKWFDYYNNRFTTLELNVTFYRFPQLSFLEGWYKKSPDLFNFSVKAPRAITHYKQFINTKELIADFYGTIQEGLKDKLGCVLFQLPPRMKYKEEKLQQIIESLDPAFTNVVEFRPAGVSFKAGVLAKGPRHVCGAGSHPNTQGFAMKTPLRQKIPMQVFGS